MRHPFPAAPGPRDRQAALTAERNRKMATSAHAYVRGSTVRFYEWLDRSDRCHVPDGPEVWICGDCHAGNLGPVASGDGRIAIQIRDLDQTVIGNPAHDLLRLGLSLAMAARGSNLPGVTTALMLERMVEGYESAFAAIGSAPPERVFDGKTESGKAGSGKVGNETARKGKAGGKKGGDLPRTVRAVMREAAGRSWKHLADERIEGLEPVIPLGRRFWPLDRAERAAVDALFATGAPGRLVARLRGGRDGSDEPGGEGDDPQGGPGHGAGGPVRVMDAAYWRKGCSSLGLLRLAVLVAVQGRHGRARHCLMDVKEATTPVTPRHAAAMPSDQAERVVTGARALSPFLGERMAADRLLGRPVFVRELLPQDLKLEIETLSRAEAMEVAQFLSAVVGRAHARQMDGATRRAWLAELRRNPTKGLDAPSWLWSSIVELIGTHERAYLEHCRRHAMEGAS